jgi:hypothetical protein
MLGSIAHRPERGDHNTAQGVALEAWRKHEPHTSLARFGASPFAPNGAATTQPRASPWESPSIALGIVASPCALAGISVSFTISIQPRMGRIRMDEKRPANRRISDDDRAEPPYEYAMN